MTTIADIKKMNRFEAADLLTSMADMRDDETEEYFKNCDDYREICDEAQSDPSPKRLIPLSPVYQRIEQSYCQ